MEPRTNLRKYGSAMEWLIAHRMVRRVSRVSEPGCPLSGFIDPTAFRLYFSDVGLFSHLCGIEPALREGRPELFPALWKSLAEHFILQSLAAQFDEPLRYWSNPKPQTSVDFLANLQGTVVPIAVDVTGKSRAPIPQLYRERYGSRTPLCVRFSWRNLGLTGNLLDIPFFLANEAYYVNCRNIGQVNQHQTLTLENKILLSVFLVSHRFHKSFNLGIELAAAFGIKRNAQRLAAFEVNVQLLNESLSHGISPKSKDPPPAQRRRCSVDKKGLL